MLFKEEKAYLAIANDIIENGSTHKDRTGVGTRAVFGRTMDFDLTDGKIPLISTRQVPNRFMPIELVWFISGDTDIKYLLENNVNIWNSWVKPETAVYDNDPKNFIKELEKQGVIKLDENFKEVYNHMDTAAVNAVVGMLTGKKVPDSRLLSGSIGDGAYGAQWRKWEDIRIVSVEEVQAFIDKGYKELARFNENVESKIEDRDHDTLEVKGYKAITDVVERVIVQKKIDQLKQVIDQINNNENSRRIIMSAWNVGRLDQMQLPPCFVKGSLVSTPDGYREISEIKEGDLVYSDTMKVRRVTKTYKTPYDGNLIGLGVNGMSNYLISTPCHPHLVKDKGYIRTDSIMENKDYLVMPFSNPDGIEKIHTHSITMKHNTSKTGFVTYDKTLTENDCFAIGYFIGNGWYMENSGHRVCFSIPNHKISYILPKIRDFVKVGLKNDTGSVCTYETRNEKIGTLLSSFGHLASNKQFPEWVFSLPNNFKEQILNGIYESDGYFEKDKNAVSVTTTSRKLSLGIQRLAGSLGFKVGIVFQRRKPETIIEGRVVKQRNTYSVRVNLDKNSVNKRSYIDNKIRYCLVEDKVKLSFDDNGEKFVYNLEVEEEHTYIVDNIATHNCHTLTQWNVRRGEDGTKYLTCSLFCRSQDFLVGTIANIAQYAMLTHMIAQVTGCVAERLVWFGSNVHIYDNQIELAMDHLQRLPLRNTVRVALNKDITNIDEFKPEDIKITGYENFLPPIKYPVAV